MWDFLAAAFEWIRKSLGTSFNKVVTIIVVLVAGWYLHGGYDIAVKLLDKVHAIEVAQTAAATEVVSIRDQIDTIQGTQKDMQAIQKSSDLEIRKVSTQVDTLQAVLVNKLNLMLPPIGMTTDALEEALCSL